MTSNPEEWHIASDREGFFIEDDEGQEQNPSWLLPWGGARWRTTGYANAKKALDTLISEYYSTMAIEEADAIRMADEEYNPEDL